MPPYSSVAFVLAGGGFVLPPKAIPAVCVPPPPNINLDVAKFPPAVQDEPSYSSVASVFEGGSATVDPPKANPAV